MKKKIMDKLIKTSDNYSKKNKSITLRINQTILRKVKAKALKEGIPYQTLLSSLNNQYALNC
jgi:predicted DNA binding CopG/RHH family protein